MKHQHPRHERQQRPHSSQQTTRLRKSQPVEHLRRKHRYRRRTHIATKALRRQRTARVPMIYIRQIVEHRQVHTEDPDLRDPQRNRRRDPADMRKGRPPEPKEPDRKKRAFEAREVQPSLRLGGQLRPPPPRGFLLVDTYNCANDAADCDGGEGAAVGLGVETVAGREDERDDGECHVQHRPCKSRPKGKEEDDGLGAEELEGRGGAEVDHAAEGGALFIGEDFVAEAAFVVWRAVLLMAGGGGRFEQSEVFVDGGGASGEEDRAAGLAEEEDEGRQEEAGGDELVVEHPAPGGAADDPPRDEWAEACAGKRTTGVDRHWSVAVLGVKYVAQNAADDGGEGGRGGANEEAGY